MGFSNQLAAGDDTALTYVLLGCILGGAVFILMLGFLYGYVNGKLFPTTSVNSLVVEVNERVRLGELSVAPPPPPEYSSFSDTESEDEIPKGAASLRVAAMLAEAQAAAKRQHRQSEKSRMSSRARSSSRKPAPGGKHSRREESYRA